MKVAIEGCCHGELDAIYDQLAELEQRHGYKVDVLLVCGDFEAIRNSRDLQCMAVPPKYRVLGGFHKYYTGEKVAPVLTLVIGGNHEASNYLWELYHGGWLAPNIYFLGHAGCVQVNGVRIAGVSGIFKGHDFGKGHPERVPYDQSSMRSIYHTREYDIRRLSLLSSPDIVMSHDWPQDIAHHGDLQGLLRRKRFFEADIRSGRLGSPPLMGLLHTLKPKWWFSAHLHVRFEALVRHGPLPGQGEDQAEGQPQAGQAPVVQNPDEIAIDDGDDDELEVGASTSVPTTQPPPLPPAQPSNPDEILLDDEEYVEPAPAPPPPPAIPPIETKFLALDKCLPKRQFLEVVEVDTPLSFSSSSSSTNMTPSTKPLLSFDPEWLAISRAFHPWFSTTTHQPAFPPEDEARALVAKELDWVEANVRKNDAGLVLVDEFQSFERTAPGPSPETENVPGKFQQPPHYPNSQTIAFCKMLDIEDKINKLL